MGGKGAGGGEGGGEGGARVEVAAEGAAVGGGVERGAQGVGRRRRQIRKLRRNRLQDAVDKIFQTQPYRPCQN